MKSRIALIDSLRGFALLLMSIFHFCFDLNLFGAVRIAFDSPFWLVFRTLIVTLFLGLVGASIHLGSNHYASARYWNRIVKVFSSALFISAATYVLFPAAWVFFGILHFVLFVSLLAPWIARAPRASFFLSWIALGLPYFFRSELFHSKLAAITGLATAKPVTLDLVPIFPWIGVVLLGSFLGFLAQEKKGAFLQWKAPGLALLGRHSLLFYVSHQMVLLPLAWLVARALGA